MRERGRRGRGEWRKLMTFFFFFFFLIIINMYYIKALVTFNSLTLLFLEG